MLLLIGIAAVTIEQFIHLSSPAFLSKKTRPPLVEHPFRVIKRQFGLMKVRFRGLAKNTAHVITLFALSHLWMARRRLLAMTG